MGESTKILSTAGKAKSQCEQLLNFGTKYYTGFYSIKVIQREFQDSFIHACNILRGRDEL